MAATEASRSRSPLAARTPWVSLMSRLTPTTPCSGVPTRSMKPACRKTSSMRRFSAMVSARKRVIPAARPSSARYSSSSEPTPRPWKSSLTTKATSASPGAETMKSPTPTTVPAWNAPRCMWVAASLVVSRSSSASVISRRAEK